MSVLGRPAGAPEGPASRARSSIAAQAAAARDRQRDAHVYAEQVRLLYAGSFTAITANLVNSSILTYLLWDVAARQALTNWLGAMVLLQLARLALVYLNRCVPHGSLWPALLASLRQTAQWDRWYLAGVTATGLLWGVAGFLLFPDRSAEHQLALIFTIGGTVAGGTAVLSSVRAAFPLFAFTALIPLGVRFFLEGTPHYTMMGALTFIFLAVLLNVARLIHDPIVSSIRLRLENADLVSALTAKVTDLTQINQLLKTELGGKTEAMDQLGSQVFFLQELMDAIPNPIFYKDTQGVYRGCNKALESFLGRSKSDIVGKTLFDVVPAESAGLHQQKDLELLKQGGTQAFETKLRAADGSLRTVLLCKAPYHNPLGAITGIIGVLVDLTDRKRAENELRLFHTLLDQVRDSIEIIDPDTGRFLGGNEKAWSNLGYTRSELLSLTVPDIDPKVSGPAFAQHIKRLRETGQPMILESMHRRKDGTTFLVEVRAQLIRQDREYLIAIVRDITEQKQTPA